MIFEMLVKREQAVLSAYATFEICTRIRLLYPRLVIASLVYPSCMRQFTRTILHVPESILLSQMHEVTRVECA